MAHDHHDHDDDHDNELDPMTARVRALETILAGKGLIDPAAIDAIVDIYENKVGPRNGARARSDLPACAIARGSSTATWSSRERPARAPR